MSDFLRADNIQVIYQTPKAQTEAVRDVSFAVQKGQFVSIVGPSGCGKSTILSCMAGLNTPQSGRITFEGKDIKNSLDKI
ncbi:MAG: ATP-binding cassette domain-containing protein, partial [Oscillospiraceae bacterium]|nr:ATP-binding cassette domain-containing protein [Oscillospiraceae bacterium]